MHVQIEKSMVIRNELSSNQEDEIALLANHSTKWHYAYFCYPSFILFALLIAFLGWQNSNSYIFYGTSILAIIAIGISLNSCFSLIHEATHGHLSSSRFRNRYYAVLLSTLGFFSYTAYKVLHIRHHRHLGDEHDPDEYSNYVSKTWLLWTLQYVRLLCASLLYLLLIPWFAFKYASKPDRTKIFTEYLFMATIYGLAIYLIPFKLILLFWICPWILVNFLVNIRGLVQHGVTDNKDPMIASRSLVVHPLIEFFLIYENYHLEHHLFPEVPAYNLKKLHKIIEPRLDRQVTGRSYIVFLLKFFIASLTLNEAPIGLIHKKESPEE